MLRLLQKSTPAWVVFSHTSCVGCHLRDGHLNQDAGHLALNHPGSSHARQSPDSHRRTAALLPFHGFGVQLGDRSNYGVAPEARARAFMKQRKPYPMANKFIKHRIQFCHCCHYHTTAQGGRTPAPGTTSLQPPPLGRPWKLSPRPISSPYGDPGDCHRDGISGRPNYVWIRNRPNGTGALWRTESQRPGLDCPSTYNRRHGRNWNAYFLGNPSWDNRCTGAQPIRIELDNFIAAQAELGTHKRGTRPPQRFASWHISYEPCLLKTDP